MNINAKHTFGLLSRHLASVGSSLTDPSQPLTKQRHSSKSNVFTLLAVILLLATMGIQMTLAAQNDSATTDEQIHILSGYTTLTQHHILFDPEHPFLAKALSAIPLLFIHPNVPDKAAHLTAEQATVTYNTYREANVWGFEFVFTQGNNPYQLLNLARGVIITLTILLGLLIFIWTRQNLGTPAALAALTFFTFDPTFITHGHLANDDTVAALFFVASLASFQWFLSKPNKKSLSITGLMLGFGLITKYSLLALGPVFILIAIIWHFLNKSAVQNPQNAQGGKTSVQSQASIPIKSQPHTKDRASLPQTILSKLPFLASPFTLQTSRLFLIFLIAWAVIWLSYGSLALINPAQNPLFVDYRTVYAAAIPGTHIPTPDSLAGHTLNDIGHLFPVMWLKGFALISPTAAGHSREGFLLGQCFRGSRWDYFPVLILFKTPLPVLILLAFSLIGLTAYTVRKTRLFKLASRRVKFMNQIAWLGQPKQIVGNSNEPPKTILSPKIGFILLFLVLPILIYLFIASFSDIDIGIRHILPVYSLLLILAAWPISLINWPTVFITLKTKLQAPHIKPIEANPPAKHSNFSPRDLANLPNPRSDEPGASQSERILSRAQTCILAIFAVLFLWLIIGTLRTYPNYLPYYNELAQEPRNIPYISNDSNIDWGQATKELDTYIQTHHISHFAFDNFIGYGEARYRQMPFDIAQPDNHTYKGYLAISRSTIIDHLCSQNNNWGWVVDHYQPVAIIGNAINLYYIP